MGTETPYQPIRFYYNVLKLVKLNNPQMGTETYNKRTQSILQPQQAG